jgi:hypothetical protein
LWRQINAKQICIWLRQLRKFNCCHRLNSPVRSPLDKRYNCGPGFTRKEEEAMQGVKSKRLLLLIISLAMIFALGLPSSPAQEKTKFAGKRYGVMTKTEVIKLDDTEGHILTLGESKGVDVTTGDQFVTSGLADYVKGNGPHWGYSKAITPDGDVTFSTFKMQTTTTLSPKGKPITTFEGTFSFTKGTGKFENIQGDGTFKGKMIGPGIYMYDWEGEYSIKK